MPLRLLVTLNRHAFDGCRAWRLAVLSYWPPCGFGIGRGQGCSLL